MSKNSCPHCSYSRFWKLRRNKRKCKKCRKEYSVNTYPINGIRSTEEDWKECIKIFLRERTILSITEQTSIGYNRALAMVNHIRIKMDASVPIHFNGPVEMDETYIGGQRKNKRLHIRRIKGKKGHGTDKLPIVGIFDRNTGFVYVDVLPRKLDIKYIITTIQERVAIGSKIYTDGFKMYRMLPKYGYVHEYVDHDHDELVRGDIHTNNIEGFWGILKRKLGCIGGMRRDRLHLFVAEIVWKFNHRKLTLKEKEAKLLSLILYD